MEGDDGEIIGARAELRVLLDTDEIAQVEVTALLVEEWEDGELIERTPDFLPQDQEGTVIFLGEYVDEVEDGQVVGQGGFGSPVRGTISPAYSCRSVRKWGRCSFRNGPRVVRVLPFLARGRLRPTSKCRY